ncbi:hypothetical protein C8P64_1546 [Christiangramia gaetbulicola]|uniref:Lipid A deacylase LpxR family protein n=1 Tax=Christiangramia gaetbulicola TaxID=703340 RepID=A0A2T6AGR0_9FLAO|nr:lipid A deacylase LpxR family protein [Christiangramia gaetbulicola]PTX43020.1 hypothetical protein C8P64_1546 [Christiangramia gaetbulicola]
MSFKSVPIIFIFFFAFCQKGFSQKFTNAPSYRDFSQKTYFRLNFDNDFFTHSDDNYTQGISLEFVDPIFEKNPLNFIFLDSEASDQYGIALEHVSFTPDVISSKDIQYGFRPFAAALYLKLFKTESRIKNKSRLYSSFTAGVIGPMAYGEEGQSYIHEITDNWIPYGWGNQLSNDIILNYEVKHEKNLLDLGELFYLNTDAGLRLGSMYTDISAGTTAILGLFNSGLNESTHYRKFQVYCYANPKLYLVGYDATLQGGLFSESVYTIKSSEVSRIKGQMDYGLVIKNKYVYFEYTFSTITKEFESGRAENWGGFRLGFRI